MGQRYWWRNMASICLLLKKPTWKHLARICSELFGAVGSLAAKELIADVRSLVDAFSYLWLFLVLGSYFARDASYSHEYCSSRISRYSMFVAQVLVGKFVQGDSEYLRPPPTPNNRNRLYDSCVDNPENPSIFVIFEKLQIYPAYILEYSSSSLCVIL